MKLTGSYKKIYDYLKANGEATYRELNDNLYMRKSDMRVAEMNRMYKDQYGEPLIITKRKKPNGEHVKTLAKPLMRKEQKVEIKDGVAHVTYVEVPV